MQHVTTGKHVKHVQVAEGKLDLGPTYAVRLPDLRGNAPLCGSGCGQQSTWLVCGANYIDNRPDAPADYMCEDCKDSALAWVEDFG